MAYIHSTQTAAPGLFGRLLAVFPGLTERIRRQRLYRNTLSELSALSDRDLADLGIARAQISDIAAKAAFET